MRKASRRRANAATTAAYVEQVENRVLLAAVTEYDGVAYLLSESAPQLQRFDLQNEQWLSPVQLTEGVGLPTAVHVDADGIYASFGPAVYRYNLDGSGQVHLANGSSDVKDIHSDGPLLFLNHSAGLYSNLISINKNTNTIIESDRNYLSTVSGSALSTVHNRIFGRSVSVSPSDLNYVAYDENGFFTQVGETPYHGDYPGGSQTWLFPDESRIVDDSGTMYATDNLTYLNSFGGRFDDLAFLGDDIPIVLRDRTVTSYTASILPAGSAMLEHSAEEIFVNDQNVIAFRTDNGVWTEETLALDALSPPEPGQPVDPTGLAFTPDDIATGSDGTIFLYSSSHQSIFVWDSQRQEYGPTIPLIGSANHFAYSDVTNTVYLAYDSGLIRKIDLDQDTPAEEPFAVLPGSPTGLAAAGPFVFAVDPSGAWSSHYTFDPDGTLISSRAWNYYSRDFRWNDANQKMYFFRDSTSPNDVLWEEINADGQTYPELAPGAIGAKKDSPLHSSVGMTHPIRVSPDGNLVVLGSGRLHNARTLERLATSLPNSVDDAAWLNGLLYTIRDVGDQAQIQKWEGAGFEPTIVRQVTGQSVALLSVREEALLRITLDGQSVPQFQMLDADLEAVAPPIGELSLVVDQSDVFESGGSLPVTLRRTGDSSEAIVVELLSNDESELVLPASVELPAGATEVQFTATVQDDADADGRQSVNLLARASQFVFAEVTVDVLDNEPVMVHTEGDTTVGEDGSADVFTVRLPAAPSANVVLQITSTAPDEVTVHKATLLFTPSNWDEPQSVAVTGADDDQPDGPETHSVMVSVRPDLTASEFATAASQQLTVTVLDDEPPRPRITAPMGVTHGNAPRIAWEGVDGVITYHLWLQRSGDTEHKEYSTAHTEFVGQHGQLKVGHYDLWIRGRKSDDSYTPWAYQRFSVDESATFSSMPLHGQDVVANLSWSEVDGAVTYQLWGSNVTTGESGLLNETDLTDASFTTPELSFGLYRFWVRPLGPNGFRGSWSEPVDYYVGPELQDAERATFEPRPSFRWSPVAGAQTYRLWASGPNGFVLDEPNLSETTYTPDVDLPSGRIRWWLLPSTADGKKGRWSPAGEIHVNGAPMAPTIEGEATDSTPLITWAPVGAAKNYQVFLQQAGQSETLFNTTVESNEYQSSWLADGEYILWLRAFDEQDTPGRWSTAFRFEIATATESLSAVPALPTSPTLEQDVLFRWTAAEGAASYDLYLSDGQQMIERSEISSTSTLIEKLPRSVWSWRVRARDEAGAAGPWSDSVSVDATGRPQLLTPSGPASSQRPTIIWSEVTAADSYVVVVQDVQSEQYIVRTDNLQAVEFAPDFDLNPGTYRFWVKALSADRPQLGVWSRPIELQISSAEERESGEPLLAALSSMQSPKERQVPVSVLDIADAATVAATDDSVESGRPILARVPDPAILQNHTELDAAFADPAQKLLDF